MNILIDLYKSTFSAEPSVCTALTGSASNRKYYRLSGDAGSCIGVVGVDTLENKAFLTIARHFYGNCNHRCNADGFPKDLGFPEHSGWFSFPSLLRSFPSHAQP